MLQNKTNQGCTRGSKCFKGSVDQVLLQAYKCVLQNDKARGFTQGSTVTKDCPTTCCRRHTHVCCSVNQRRVDPRVKVYKGLADHVLLGAHTHVCRRTGEFRVAPKGQRLQRFARPVVAVSTHTCVCCCAQHSRATKVSPTKCCREHTRVCCRNQGCTQGPKFYQGFADQLLLRAYTCVLQSGSLKGRSQGPPDQLLLRAYTCVFQKK